MILTISEKARLCHLASLLIGKTYRLGAETISDDLRVAKKLEEITEIDCSELVEWCFWVALRVKVPDGSWNQYAICDEVPSTEAEAGDLVFRRYSDTKAVHHVGIYVGAGMVVEAYGTQRGVITRTLVDFMANTAKSEFAGVGRINLSKIRSI